MSSPTILPDRNARPVKLDNASIVPKPRSRPEGAGHAAAPVVIAGTAPAPTGCAVAAAVNDDASADTVVAYASAEAHRLGVPLRVVHVWTGSDTSAAGARLLRHDRMCDADCLLATVLYETLPPAEADVAEREILHDTDPVRALAALSGSLSLLVVASAAARRGVLGGTASGLAGRTACPLVVVPAPEESAVW